MVSIFGETSDLKVSFQFSIPAKDSSNSGSSDSSDSDTVIDTIESSSVEGAISLVNRIYKQKNKSFTL